MPVQKVLSKDFLTIGIKYLFDWSRKVWVEHPDQYPSYNGTWHSQFLCREVEGSSQFWLEVVPATAKLLTDFGLRNEHLLKAIEPTPPWLLSRVVMFYMETQIAAALVDHQPEQSVPPSWWFQEPTQLGSSEKT